MTVKELIEKLAGLPSDANVYVWQGYNAGCMTNDFDIEVDEGDVLLA
jgi:hypothetical protein